MGLYNKASLELLCQQIERDNPATAGMLDAASILVLSGPLTTGLGTSGRNARIILNGRLGNGFVGKKEFFYDRLNIGQMFKGITVVFQAEGSSKTYADLLPALNAQYGLGLTTEDITNGTTKLPYGYAPTQLTLTIAATSLAYTGTLAVTWSRKPVGVFPESGPGSKVMLIGDMNEGYFGVVTEAELFSPVEVLSQLNEGRTEPYGTLTAMPTSRFWYKFARDGKIFYLANYNHISIRWQELYRLGGIYETDTPDNKQFPPDGVLSRQKSVLKKKENGRDWYLSPTTPKLAGSDPWEYAGTNQTPDPNGDVARLFAKIVPSGGFATGEWDGQAINADGFWMSTTSQATPANTYGSSMIGTNQGQYNKTNFVGGWRPFLELVDVTKIALGLNPFSGVPEGVLRKPLVSISPEVTDVLLTLSDVKWEQNGALRIPLVSQTLQPLQMTTYFGWTRLLRPALVTVKHEPIRNVNQVGWTRPLRRPVAALTVDYKESTAFNLANANGELNGFK
ncbi:putative virion structural protein [Erwinia phage vB_EamM_Stratton]|uniref:Putative virion structural protein n=1 Tax=Erwinia phage vB_EamM_Stratton TaxID=1883378 RepID=A0A1B2IH88_9CAUD|nr:putative virion structural protein [Erwinia phage vB_EamM_Stratton]